MKVLLINGSPHREGNTFIALSEVAKALEANGVEAEIVSIGTKAVQGCIACGRCRELGRCVFKDELYQRIREKLETADGLVVGSPVYYAGPNGSLCLARPSVLFCRRLAGLQACCLGGCMPSWGSQCDVRPPEQVFHHQQHAGGIFPILEQRARQVAGRSESGHRGIADHAYAGAQHGVAAEELEAGRRACPAQ